MTSSHQPLHRRRFVKASAASVVAATVWAEPTIRGLARRPAYAAAGSGDDPIAISGTEDLDNKKEAFFIVGGVTLKVNVQSTSIIFTLVSGATSPASLTGDVELRKKNGEVLLAETIDLTLTGDPPEATVSIASSGAAEVVFADLLCA